MRKTIQAGRLAVRIARTIKNPPRPFTVNRLLTLNRRLDIVESHIPGIWDNAVIM